MVNVAANYQNIRARIGEAAARVGRDPNSVKLLAAAKSQSAEAISAAIAGGVALIGENYVQEAQEKKARLSEPAEWHMIGHLQRNKAKLAVQLFDLIESLDGIALARELDKEGRSRGKRVRVFVEVNVAGEESKSGIAKSAVASLMEGVAELSHLRIEGLMTVPPFRENLEDVRPYFRELRELKDQLNAVGLPNVELKELSMGMTHDYTVAIEEGATIVRVGTALFGPRKA
jgi:pyridoxal phosphate enzyme (YggS family)